MLNSRSRHATGVKTIRSSEDPDSLSEQKDHGATSAAPELGSREARIGGSSGMAGVEEGFRERRLLRIDQSL